MVACIRTKDGLQFVAYDRDVTIMICVPSIYISVVTWSVQGRYIYIYNINRLSYGPCKGVIYIDRLLHGPCKGGIYRLSYGPCKGGYIFIIYPIYNRLSYGPCKGVCPFCFRLLK